MPILRQKRADGGYDIDGTPADETIFGSARNDRITGDGRADGLGTAHGSNLILAGAGDDTVHAGYGGDTVFGGSGDDLIHGYGFQGGPTAGATASLILNDGPDLLFGGAGGDTILGGGGGDTILGGPGDDLIRGGAGADLMAGGPGHDVFAFGSTPIFQRPDSGVGEGVRDVVLDFRPGIDKIDLRELRPGTSLRTEVTEFGLLVEFMALGRPQEIALLGVDHAGSGDILV